MCLCECAFLSVSIVLYTAEKLCSCHFSTKPCCMCYCRKMVSELQTCRCECDRVIDEVTQALNHLETLKVKYVQVATKTNALHEDCENLLEEQVFSHYSVNSDGSFFKHVILLFWNITSILCFVLKQLVIIVNDNLSSSEIVVGKIVLCLCIS